MSAKSRRWIRSTRCEATGRRRYASEYDAERDRRRIYAVSERQGSAYLPADAYDCQHCSGWHLAPTLLDNAPTSPAPQARPGSRQRRRQWQAALTVELLDRCPECQVRGRECAERAVAIVPLDQPDLRNPAAWATACGPCRDATQNTTTKGS